MVVTSYKPNDFPVFVNPPFLVIKKLFDQLKKYLHNYKNVLGIKENSDFSMDRNTMIEILIRIEKRRVYYHIFHNGMDMGERKIGALFCFWIMKLMPFSCKGKSNDFVNSRIALCAFINMLYASAARRKKTVMINAEIMDNLIYSFMYRDLSKEALMLMADSFMFPVARDKLKLNG